MFFNKILNHVKFFSLLLFIFLLFISAAQALTAPSNFNAVAKPGKKVILSWQKVSGARGYNIYRKAEKEKEFTRLNAGLVQKTTLEDKKATQGKSYDYFVRAVDRAGFESKNSNMASAPNMFMKTVASITHLAKIPVILKSIITGKAVTFAVPGDIINYRIVLGNNGYGKATNIVVTYPIPRGTVFLPASANINDFRAVVSYFDSKAGHWISEVTDEKNISKIRFKIQDPIPPKKMGTSGYLAFKVLIAL